MRVLFSGNGNNISYSSTHMHEGYEIILTIAGSATSIIGEAQQTAARGHITLIPPHTPHRLENGEGYCDLYIQTDELPLLDNTAICLSDESGMIEPLMRTLYTVWIQKEKNYKQIADNLLGIIYAFIVKAYESNSKYDFVTTFKNTLTINLANPDFNFATEAERLGLSLDYLRHCFKADTGQTPLDYLVNLRLQQAKRYLLQNNTYTVSEIAYLCGFSDPYYFSRCFKKHIGVSPKQYRTKTK